MAKAKKDRKSYLNKIARGGAGAGSRSQYLKYKDLSPSDVHEGSASYRGSTTTDAPGTNLNTHTVNVYRGGAGKNYYRYQGKLYQVTHSGTQHREI